MTEEEREVLRKAKEDVTRKLALIDIDGYMLADTDQRLDAYCRMVADDPDGHNLWEQLAVKRFFNMIDRYGLDSRAVKRFFVFYEFLSFPGKNGSCRYRLTPVQCFQFASVYGFYHPDGRRVVRECVLFVPRKYSKTTSSAAFALWDLLFGDANAESYIGANSQDQAKKCFDVIRGALRKLDPDGRRFVVNEQMVKPTRRNPRSAFAQCLTANARTKDGLNASTVIMDEFSQARDRELLDVLTTSMGVRSNPLTVIITTASDIFTGPFYSQLEGYKQVLLGNFEDDSLFAHLFEPDVDDQEDDPATWRKVHPHLGVTVLDDFYEGEWLKAQRNGPEARLAFRTKLLNIFCESERASWIPASLARECMKSLDLNNPGQRYDSTIAIDLSVRDDFSAVTCGWYVPKEDRFHYHTRYFFPEGALEGHPNERLYRGWASQGHLVLLPGDIIDYSHIANYILSLNTPLRTIAIGYDAYKAKDTVNILETAGAGSVLRPISQTLGSFTAATESFEVAMRTGRITINPNPVNAYCFGNAILVRDAMDNCKPDKRSEWNKIDGVITMVMCHKMFLEAYQSPAQLMREGKL